MCLQCILAVLEGKIIAVRTARRDWRVSAAITTGGDRHHHNVAGTSPTNVNYYRGLGVIIYLLLPAFAHHRPVRTPYSFPSSSEVASLEDAAAFDQWAEKQADFMALVTPDDTEADAQRDLGDQERRERFEEEHKDELQY